MVDPAAAPCAILLLRLCLGAIFIAHAMFERSDLIFLNAVIFFCSFFEKITSRIPESLGYRGTDPKLIVAFGGIAREAGFQILSELSHDGLGCSLDDRGRSAILGNGSCQLYIAVHAYVGLAIFLAQQKYDIGACRSSGALFVAFGFGENLMRRVVFLGELDNPIEAQGDRAELDLDTTAVGIEAGLFK